MKRTTVYIPTQHLKQIEKLTRKTGMPRSEFIRRAISNALDLWQISTHINKEPSTSS